MLIKEKIKLLFCPNNDENENLNFIRSLIFIPIITFVSISIYIVLALIDYALCNYTTSIFEENTFIYFFACPLEPRNLWMSFVTVLMNVPMRIIIISLFILCLIFIILIACLPLFVLYGIHKLRKIDITENYDNIIEEE